MKTLLILTIGLLTQIAAAGDASFYKSLGFSADGKYYAYTQDGVYDGLGAYWVELGIVDVVNNKYVGRAKVGGEDMNGDITEPDQAPAMLKGLKKKLNFKKYGFSKVAKEDVLISRPHTDFSIYTNSVFSTEYWAQGGASSSVQTYELLLSEVDAPIVNGVNDWCWNDNKMIDLKIKTQDIYGNGNEVINDLQVDTKQPGSRACSFNYSISYVFHHKNSVTVVLNYMGPGFEGPDYRYMVITGKL